MLWSDGIPRRWRCHTRKPDITGLMIYWEYLFRTRLVKYSGFRSCLRCPEPLGYLCQYQTFAKINGIKWVSPLFCVSWISWVYYISLFLFVLISGIIKTIQAIKKKTLPMNVRISWFLKLDTIKKMAHKIKSIQPIIWYFISCLSWFSCFSFINNSARLEDNSRLGISRKTITS